MRVPYAIRVCEPPDCLVIAGIYNQAVARGGATFDRELKSKSYFQELIANFRDKETLLVLVPEEEVIGWGIIKQYSERSAYQFTCETSVLLARTFREKAWVPT